MRQVPRLEGVCSVAVGAGRQASPAPELDVAQRINDLVRLARMFRQILNGGFRLDVLGTPIRGPAADWRAEMAHSQTASNTGS